MLHQGSPCHPKGIPSCHEDSDGRLSGWPQRPTAWRKAKKPVPPWVIWIPQLGIQSLWEKNTSWPKIHRFVFFSWPSNTILLGQHLKTQPTKLTWTELQTCRSPRQVVVASCHPSLPNWADGVHRLVAQVDQIFDMIDPQIDFFLEYNF